MGASCKPATFSRQLYPVPRVLDGVPLHECALPTIYAITHTITVRQSACCSLAHHMARNDSGGTFSTYLLCVQILFMDSQTLICTCIGGSS